MHTFSQTFYRLFTDFLVNFGSFGSLSGSVGFPWVAARFGSVPFGSRFGSVGFPWGRGPVRFGSLAVAVRFGSVTFGSRSGSVRFPLARVGFPLAAFGPGCALEGIPLGAEPLWMGRHGALPVTHRPPPEFYEAG